jgi:SAM-dependent methyltransferase
MSAREWADACPACDAPGSEVFYEVAGVPAHSCLLMATPEEARAYPRGDIALAFCRSCGFIQNAAFDPRLPDYSPRYEETQAFSPRFLRFLRALARDLVERHGLRGGHALEIGCGKGEFLELLCEEGCARATGIDPGCRPERLTGAAAARVRLVRDRFDERWGPLDADLVACRHTLEHIAGVGAFLRLVRRALGDRAGAAVFFEVPDVRRVLAETAFWDVYYEHTSYFSLGALVRVFRASGFRVLRVERAYAAQYLLLEAAPASGPGAAEATPAGAGVPVAGEDDLAELAALVERFREEAPRRALAWAEEIRALARRGPLVLWGSGSKAVALLTTCDLAGCVRAVVDINPHKHGRFMPGTGEPIVGPEALVAIAPATVVVMNAIYREEIGRELERLGLSPRLVALP